MIISLAGKQIDLSFLYESTRRFLKDYEVTSDIQTESDFSVVIRPEHIERERKKAAREDLASGLSPRQFPDAYLEQLAIYRQIAEKMPFYQTLLIHGSVIAVDGKGYMFTAKSGTGKSTHARLWRELLGERARMINDDKPLVRITESGIKAFGTPWDGKHHLSMNAQAPLKAICFLEQAKENSIEPITSQEAYLPLLAQVYRPADPQALAKSLQLLDILKEKVSFFHLACNMDPDAARIAWEMMRS